MEDKPLDQQTLAELKQTAASEGIQGLESFDKKAQVLTIINSVRSSRSGDLTPQAPLPPQPAAPTVDEAAALVPPVNTAAPEVPPAAPIDTPTPEVNLPAEDPMGGEDMPPQAPVVAAPAAPATIEPAAPVSPAEEQTDQREWKKEVDTIKAVLDAQPKVRIMIPLDIGEKRGTSHPVIINGYRVDILKGVYVSVAQAIADEIMNSFNQTAEIGKDIELGRTDPETGRPVATSMGLQG